MSTLVQMQSLIGVKISELTQYKNVNIYHIISAFIQPERAGTPFRHLFSRQLALCNSVFFSRNSVPVPFNLEKKHCIIFIIIQSSINQDISNVPANKISRWSARQTMDEIKKKMKR